MLKATPYEKPRQSVWGGTTDTPATPDLDQAWDSSSDDEQIATFAYCLGEMYPTATWNN